MKTPSGIELAHDDHGLTEPHLRFIDTLLSDWDGSFTILHVDMPDGCPALPSALYGPAAGDKVVTEGEVSYEKRGNRPGPSRLIDRPSRPCRKMVLIAGPGREGPIIYTAFGSPVRAPREWWDSSMLPHEALESASFWMEHALGDKA